MNKITTTGSTTTVTNSNLSSVALRRLFGWIESRYGGNIPMEQNVTVITVPDHHQQQHRSTNQQQQQQQQRILHSEDLVRLMQHDPGVIAIHVKEFYPKAMAIQIGKQLTQEAENGSHTTTTTTATTVQNWNISTNNRGLESSDVTTMGAYSPYNIVVSSSRCSHNNNTASDGTYSKDRLTQNEDEYFIGVQKENYQRRRRKSFDGSDEPFLWPLDLLRLQLDEAWPSGAGLARRYSHTNTTTQRPFLLQRPILPPIHNPPYGGGLPRIMYGPTRYTKGFVHVDEMGPLHSQNGLFSANIYLQLPDQTPVDQIKDENSYSNNSNKNNSNDSNIPQEVLEIWPTRIMKRWDWYRNMLLLTCLSSTNIQDQIRLRHELGSVPVRIAVTPGDLVLFCVQRPHAAIGFQYGTRVSLQCFIQHHGIHQRLLIDS